LQPELHEGLSDLDLVAALQTPPLDGLSGDARAGGRALVLELVVLSDAVDGGVTRSDVGVLEEVDLALGRRSDPRGVPVQDELLAGDRTTQELHPGLAGDELDDADHQARGGSD